MSKIKDILPKLFGGGNRDARKASATAGRLETDAAAVFDDINNEETSVSNQIPSVLNSPTASTDLTLSTVRVLSDPNYNSLEVANTPSDLITNAEDSLEIHDGTVTGNSTMNTMNVNNAQQQVVMQFSNVNKLHFGSVYNFNQPITAGASTRAGSGSDDKEELEKHSKSNSKMRQTPRKTVTIVNMMQSNEEPNHRMLDTIASHLGEGWKQVMRDLGHSEGQIDQAIIDNHIHGGIKEVIYQLLLQWVQAAEDGVATVGSITTLLWRTHHRDCVQRMKMAWKAERKDSR